MPIREEKKVENQPATFINLSAFLLHMNTCDACGSAIPKTQKLCEECKESGPFADVQEGFEEEE